MGATLCNHEVLAGGEGEPLLDYMGVETAVRFLGKGIVKCEDYYNEKSFVYDFRVAPIVLSETVSFLNNTRSHISLETLTECEMIELPRAPFLDLMFKHIDLARFCMIGVVNYLGMMHHRFALMRTLMPNSVTSTFSASFQGWCSKPSWKILLPTLG